MKIKYWCLLFISSLLIIITGCSKDQPTDTPEEKSDPMPEIPLIEVTVTMKEAVATGVVTDINGNPLEGVSIISGEAQATTNEKGLFTFERVASANNRFLFTFKKEGYFNIIRSGVFKDNLSMRVIMQSKSGASNVCSTSFNSTQKNTLKTGGMEVVIPASSLVTSTGTSYTGTVKAELFYLSPDNENFTTMMPGGDMAAMRSDRSSATLVSYGMVEVSLTDNSGSPLQLKEGSQSEMTFPIPENMKGNPPASIPLWFFNEEAGIWVEEGTAKLKGSVYIGSVRHFSWHNLDVPEERVTIKGRVTDKQGGAIPNLLVTVDQTSDVTDRFGNYQVYVPANTPVSATVKSKDYYSYTPEVAVKVSGQPGGTTVENVNLELPYMPIIQGHIINSCAELVAAYVWVEYTLNGKVVTTTPIWTSIDGAFELRIPVTSGKATLWVETIAGDKISRDLTLSKEGVVIDKLEICEKLDESLLIITVEGGQSFVLPWKPETSLGMLLNSKLTIMNGRSMIGITYEFLGAGKESIGDFIYTTEQTICHFGSVQYFFEAAENETYNINISGTGMQYSLSDNSTKDATITGKISLANLIQVIQAGNVSKWSDVGVGNAIPEMPLPIDYLTNLNFHKQNAVLASLGYNQKTVSDYEAIKSTLVKAGYALVEQEVTDESGNKSSFYKKEDNLIAMAYFVEGGGYIMGDDVNCKLVITLFEGYSKLQQFKDIFISDVATRSIRTKK